MPARDVGDAVRAIAEHELLLNREDMKFGHNLIAHHLRELTGMIAGVPDVILRERMLEKVGAISNDAIELIERNQTLCDVDIYLAADERAKAQDVVAEDMAERRKVEQEAAKVR